MKYVKLLLVNIIIFFLLLLIIEFLSGASRILIGKEFLLPQAWVSEDIFSPSHPCNEMKTDVLLSHAPNHEGNCKILGGKALDEYVTYDISDPSKPVLLTLGGSTTSGFYQHISKGETYPKELARLLSDEFFVLNGGIGGYSSLQELYKFMRDGSRIENLKVVVALNGVNELPDYHGFEETRKSLFPYLTETQYLMNSKQNWVEQRVTRGLGLERLKLVLPNLISLFFYVQSSSINLDKPEETEINSSIERNDLFRAASYADRWETNVKRLNEMVLLEGASYFLFLQPTLGLSGPQSNPQKASQDEILLKQADKEYIKKIQGLYVELKKRCSNLSFCFDISDKVPPKGNVYNDLRHHNDLGNKILAEVIASDTSENLDTLKSL